MITKSELKEEVDNLNEILIAGMSQNMLREKISAKLEYSQWTVETFMDDNKAVIRDWDEEKYYIVEFSVNGEEVEVKSLLDLMEEYIQALEDLSADDIKALKVMSKQLYIEAQNQ